MVELTVISTFAGCGGSSLGYKMAGFKELLAIDWDDNSEKTFKINFPNVPFWNKDITKVSGQEILKETNLKKGELDVLDGSPPCQGFSTAGKRVIQDNRNDLFKEFVKLVNELEPKVFVMENVPGMMRGDMKGKFNEILKVLKETNYLVKCKLLNAKYFGVPQSRERLFFIGIRKDLNKEPIFPKPNNKIISIQKALKNIKELGEKKTPSDKRAKYIKEMKQGEKLDKYTLNKSGFTTVKPNYSKPAPTITKTLNLIHPIENRYFTINELKRLASFPDTFIFIGSFEQQWARIGNAVMPLQMKAIAETIKEEILNGEKC